MMINASIKQSWFLQSYLELIGFLQVLWSRLFSAYFYMQLRLPKKKKCDCNETLWLQWNMLIQRITIYIFWYNLWTLLTELIVSCLKYCSWSEQSYWMCTCPKSETLPMVFQELLVNWCFIFRIIVVLEEFCHSLALFEWSSGAFRAM